MQTIQPTGGDDTGLIQAAITANYGSELVLDGVSNAMIDGIDFNAVAGPVSAIRLGTACSNIVVGANAKGAGVV